MIKSVVMPGHTMLPSLAWEGVWWLSHLSLKLLLCHYHPNFIVMNATSTFQQPPESISCNEH